MLVWEVPVSLEALILNESLVVGTCLHPKFYMSYENKRVERSIFSSCACRLFVKNGSVPIAFIIKRKKRNCLFTNENSSKIVAPDNFTNELHFSVSFFLKKKIKNLHKMLLMS